MSLNLIGIAIPFFMLFIGIEVWLARRKRRRLHRFTDSMSDLACGMGEQLVGLFWGGVKLALYEGIVHHAAWLELSASDPLTWLIAMVGVDFFYYWYHRGSHRVSFLWATHVVHHQSEDYNLAVALRQPWFSQFTSWLFYVPLALLGVPTVVFAACSAINLLYQFWIHTELIDKLGPLEWVLNTPSHHRVHHGIDSHYLDRNYGGILILWDRLFGSFMEEDATPHYGTLKPLRRWSAWSANVGPFVQLTKKSMAAPTMTRAVETWFRPPAWDPATATEAHPNFPPSGRGYNEAPRRWVYAYVCGQFLPLSLGITYALIFSEQIGGDVKAFSLLTLGWTALSLCWLLEGRDGSLKQEWARLACVLGVSGALAGWLGSVLAVGLAVYVVISAATLWGMAQKQPA